MRNIPIAHSAEVSRVERERFFDALSRAHQGALVTLAVNGREEVSLRPFEGLSCDYEDVIVHLGGATEIAHLGHIVPRVSHVFAETTGEGADVAIEMLSRDGTRTVVQFASPMRPEITDPAVE